MYGLQNVDYILNEVFLYMKQVYNMYMYCKLMGVRIEKNILDNIWERKQV